MKRFQTLNRYSSFHVRRLTRLENEEDIFINRYNLNSQLISLISNTIRLEDTTIQLHHFLNCTYQEQILCIHLQIKNVRTKNIEIRLIMKYKINYTLRQITISCLLEWTKPKLHFSIWYSWNIEVKLRYCSIPIDFYS